jgi:hypothetical protein
MSGQIIKKKVAGLAGEYRRLGLIIGYFVESREYGRINCARTAEEDT